MFLQGIANLLEDFLSELGLLSIRLKDNSGNEGNLERLFGRQGNGQVQESIGQIGVEVVVCYSFGNAHDIVVCSSMRSFGDCDNLLSKLDRWRFLVSSPLKSSTVVTIVIFTKYKSAKSLQRVPVLTSISSLSVVELSSSTSTSSTPSWPVVRHLM